MGKMISIDEQFQHFLTDLKESFRGDLEAKTRLAWKQFLEPESERMRHLYMGYESYERGPRPTAGYRNGLSERDSVTALAPSGCALPGHGRRASFPPVLTSSSAGRQSWRG
jgi:hypothetical protein